MFRGVDPELVSGPADKTGRAEDAWSKAWSMRARAFNAFPAMEWERAIARHLLVGKLLRWNRI